jgi:hypothetical protein
MSPAVKAIQLTIRIAGSLQLILGVLVWTGRLNVLLFVHIMIGMVLVLGLWILAGLASRAGVKPGWVGLLIIWGLVMLFLGLTQALLLTGSAHWIIQVLHLLVGVGAIGLAEMLTRQPVLMKGPAQAD